MFRHIKREEALRRDEIKKASNRAEVASSTAEIAFVTMAEQGAIDEVTATEHVEVFSPWAEGTAYTAGNLRSYDGILYKCVQAHTSQPDWTPDRAVSLWAKAGDPAEEYPEWSQPVGAHDAYQSGDKVTYNGRHYVSSVDNNIWRPDVYGWQAN